MFSMTYQKAPATPMQYASAYVPTRPFACPTDDRCPINGNGNGNGVANNNAHADTLDPPDGRDTDFGRATEDVQSDVQRQVNDIKKTHLRWLPWRFLAARHQLLDVASRTGQDALPTDTVLAPLWPPVPRSRDIAKKRGRLDIHGHVIAIKLWTKAVLFVCRYDPSLSREQKDALCRTTAGIIHEAQRSHNALRWYDVWRLAAAQRHVAQARETLGRQQPG